MLKAHQIPELILVTPQTLQMIQNKIRFSMSVSISLFI